MKKISRTFIMIVAALFITIQPIKAESKWQDAVDTLRVSNKPINYVVAEVIYGIWGNGMERREALTEFGYDYDEVQDAVNEKIAKSAEKMTQSGEKAVKTAERIAKSAEKIAKSAKKEISKEYPKASGKVEYTLKELQFHGILRWNGYKFTYYSHQLDRLLLTLYVHHQKHSLVI